MEENEIYEPPVVVGLGEFAESTRGTYYGTNVDGYFTGWYYPDSARG